MKRILIWILAIAIALPVAASIYFRTVSDDPAVWHADPLTATRTGSPNDYVVAPPGLRDDADRVAGVHPIPPKDLLFQFDSVASPTSRRLAGSLDDLHITYVQRTPLMGYPDYISVKAVETGDGSALVIFSRSRFGESDFGVNKSRIDNWLAQIGEAAQ